MRSPVGWAHFFALAAAALLLVLPELIAAQEGSSEASPPAVQVELSSYRARLEGSRLVGTAELEILGDPGTAALFRWPAGNWVISNPRWGSGQAKLGYSGGGQLGLLVPARESHPLTFSWSAPGSTGKGGLLFQLPFPPALRGELVLVLPQSVIPVTHDGIISGPVQVPGAKEQRWSIRWSLRGTLELQLHNATGDRPFPALLVWSRHLEVEIFEQETSIQAQFLVRPGHQPIDHLEIECTAEVRVYDWQGARVRDWDQEAGRIVLDFAEPLEVGTDRVITMQALGPGPANGHWTLPRITLRGGFWTGGLTEVRAREQLLYDVEVTDGRLVAPRDDASEQPEVVVEHFRPESNIASRVALVRPLTFSEVHTTIELGPRVQASSAVIWRMLSGSPVSLHVRIPPKWSVQKTEGLSDELIPQQSVQSYEDGTQVLVLRRGHAPPREPQIRALIRLIGPEVNRRSGEVEFAIPRIQPLDNVLSEETGVVRAGAGWSAELVEASGLGEYSGASPKPGVQEPVFSEKTSFFEEDSAGEGSGPEQSAAYPVLLGWRFHTPQSKGKLIVRRVPVRLATNLQTTVELIPQRAVINWSAEVQVGAGQPRSLDVYFSAPTDDALQWELPDGFRARRLSDVERTDDAQEVWRITLPQSVTDHAHLNASWNTATSRQMTIPLLQVLRSDRTEGQVIVAVSPALQCSADAVDLEPRPVTPRLGPDDWQPSQPRRHAWGYAGPNPQLQLELVRATGAPVQDAWITRTRVSTMIDSAGNAVHRVLYRVYSRNGATLVIELPEGAEFRGTIPGSQPLVRTDPRYYQAWCPPSRQPSQVQFEYHTEAQPLGRWGRLTVPLPKPSLRQMQLTWELITPGEYEPLSWSDQLRVLPPHPGGRWPERLFGMLARPPAQGMFRFWRAEAWREWWEQRAEEMPKFPEQQLDGVLDLLVRESPPAERTWGGLLGQLDRRINRNVLIDTAALEAVGVAPSTPVLPLRGSSSPRFRELLDSGGLALLEARWGLLLTGRTEAESLAEGRTRKLGDTPGLLEAIHQAMLHGSDASGRFVTVRNWLSLDASGIRTAVGRGPERQRPGRRWGFVAGADELPKLSVTVIHSDSVTLAAWLASVIALALGVVWRSQPGPFRLAMCGLVGGVGLALAGVLPGAIASLPAAVGWCGLALGCFWWLRYRPARAGEPKGPKAPPDLASTLSQAQVAGMALLCTLALAARLPAQPPDVAPSHQTLARAPSLTDLVLVQSVHYSGSLTNDRLNLTAVLELECFGGEEPKQILLPWSGVQLSSATLDERPCVVRPVQGDIAVEVPGRGKHRLRLEGVLGLEASSEQGLVELRVPPVPLAEFDLAVPPELSVELGGGSDAPLLSRRSEGGHIRVELGGLSGLQIRWRRGSHTTPKFQTVNASLLSWDWAGTRLDVRLNVVMQAGSLSELVIEPDPRLVLESVRAPGLAGYTRREYGRAERIVLKFDQPIATQVAVDLGFLVRENNTARMQVPDVRVLAAAEQSRWIAVRGGIGMRLRLVGLEQVPTAEPDEFQAHWPEPLPGAQGILVFRPTAESAPLEIENDGSEPTSRLRINTELSFRRGRVGMQSQITRLDGAAGRFRQELTLPPGLVLRDVVASEGTQWAASTPDRILWYGRATGLAEPRIELDGWLPITGGRLLLPWVRPVGEVRVEGEVRVFHTRGLELSVIEPQGLQLLDTSQPPAALAERELVGPTVYGIKSSDSRAIASVVPQSPEISATVAMRVLVTNRAAELDWVIDYVVNRGVTNAVQVRVPSWVGGSIRAYGQGIRSPTVRQEGSDELWTIRLEQPCWTSGRLRLEARLELGPEGRMQVPLVSPVVTGDVQQMLLLLSAAGENVEVGGAEDQQVVPATRFRRWFDLGEHLAVGAFAVRDPLPRVEVVRGVREVESASVTAIYERHQLSVGSGGRMVAESRLRVRARRGGELPLRLPSGSELHGVSVDGRLAAPAMRPDGQLSVYLDAAAGVPEVRLWWLADGRPLDSEIHLPALTDSAAARAWTVLTPPDAAIVSSPAQPTCRSLAEAGLAKAMLEELESLFSLPDQRETASGNETVMQIEQAFFENVLRGREAVAREAAVGLKPARLQAAHRRAQWQLSGLLVQNRRLMERTGLNTVMAAAANRAAELLRPVGILVNQDRVAETPAGFDRPAVGYRFYFFVRNDRDVSVRLRPVAHQASPVRLVGTTCAMAALGALVFLMLARLRSILGRVALPILLMVAGLCWCWLLKPEPVGPLLLAISVIAALIALRDLVRIRSPA